LEKESNSQKALEVLNRKAYLTGKSCSGTIGKRTLFNSIQAKIRSIVIQNNLTFKSHSVVKISKKK